MVVADQDDIGAAQRSLNFITAQDRLVRPECPVEFAKIFPAALRILRTDLALHSRQRV